MTQQTLTFSKFVEEPPFPKFIQFETGTACNADCLMCPHSKMKRSGTAKWSMLNKIIREAAPKVESMCPFLMQEPTIELRMTSILANIKQRNRNCKTVLYSNLNSLPDQTIKDIVDGDILDELHISFYGPTPELYKKWQPPLDRDRTIVNIKKLYVYRTLKKRLRPSMTVHVLGVPEIMEATDGYNEVSCYVDNIAAVQYDTFHGDMPDYGGDQTRYFGEPAPRVPCQRLWSGMNIHFDGSVVPCCIDYNDEHVLGNVNDKTLEEIWNDLPYAEFRRLHAEGRWNEIAMCRRCRVHEYQFNKEWVEYWVNRQKAN